MWHVGLDRHHDVWTASLEAQDVGQTLTFAVKGGLTQVKTWSSLSFIGSWLSFAPALRQQITLWPQMMRLLQVEDRRLGKEEVLADVLSVVSVLHFLLVDVVDELLDLVLSVASASRWRKPWIWLNRSKILWVAPGVVAEKMLLEERRQLGDLEVFTIFCIIFWCC